MTRKSMKIGLAAMAGPLGLALLMLQPVVGGSGALAQMSPEAEWKKTVAAANKEGSLILLVPPSRTQRVYLTENWSKEFPKIKLSLTSMRGGKWLQRVKAERNAGKFLWDGAGSGAVTGVRSANAGILDPILPQIIWPDIKDPKTWGGWDATFFDNAKKYVFTSQFFLKMPFYNTKYISPEKLKRMGTKIFLDPSLKGKIIWHEPLVGGSGQSFGVIMRRILGDEGFKKFVGEQVVYVGAMNDLIDKMARGQYAISLGPVMTNLLKRYSKAGVKFDIRPTGNIPALGAYGNTGGSAWMVVKNRPHPNAMKVFLNWVLSKRVAGELAKAMAQDSRRVDVPRATALAVRPVPGVKYITPQREDMTKELKASHAFIRKVRNK